MDREILFKGCTVLGNKWIKGIYIPFTDKQFGYIIDRVTGEHILCYNKSIGQYAGLTDKNGEKIFEGDIIAKGFERYEVKWNAEQMRWGIYSDNYEVAGFTKFSEPYFEVIGNLYDNPKLLRSENG